MQISTTVKVQFARYQSGEGGQVRDSPLQHLIKRKVTARPVAGYGRGWASGTSLLFAVDDGFIDLANAAHARLNVEQEIARASLGGIVVGRAVQYYERRGSTRQLVQLLPTLKLQAMLDPAQELIGLRQLVEFFAAEMTFIVQFL